MKVISFHCTGKAGLTFGMKVWEGELVDFVEMIEDDGSFGDVCILNVHEVLDEDEWARWEKIINY